MRVLHARARADATFHEPDPRDAMTRLAREFPGALRELDELPLATIGERIAELDAAIGDATRITGWMRAMVAFHRRARGALAVKRWLAGRPITGTTRDELARDLASLEHGEDARAWLDAIDAVRRPPRGRVMDLVYARVADELGFDEGAVRRAMATRGRRVRST